uniref:NadR/Ttd14 AAA domain-containing protein n=1 Tax=Calcidiscus leptoporus TaxID=127549 RepID=A0A7S0P2L2_9EUKA|mmetsp:Transcript_52626/g.120887  ORF Transcript_52626/g.120887 Transcript_52626/m.120887 type:complete len:294 (+) Transcript_52626:262-1143(+)
MAHKLMLLTLHCAVVAFGLARDDGPGIGEGPMHRVYEKLTRAGRSRVSRRASKFHKPTETRVIRIVLTGGPCGGKSSSLAPLMESAKREGFDVYCAPEIATMVFNCGFSFPTPDDPRVEEKILAFQTAVFKLQLQLERSMTLIAASTGRPSIIIFDRGLLDGKAYMSGESWTQLLHDVAHDGRDVVLLGEDVSEEYILHRYDGVIHLVTAADGAEAFYKHRETQDDQGNIVFRRESAAQAIEQDRRTRECWADHPQLVVVRNPVVGVAEDGFRRKLATATEAVLTIARRAQPL